MRYGELAFLVLLTVYHVFLLLGRHRRPFAANYLVFVAGMALAWNLGLEGLRWQTLPAIALFLIDLAVLFPSFATLRGALPEPGLGRLLLRLLRTLVASVAFLWAVGCGLLAVAFPLPQVELTGGQTPSERIVHFPAEGSHRALEVRLWYPAAGDTRPQPRTGSQAESWARVSAAGGPPVFWQSYLDRLPTNRIRGGKLAAVGTRYPLVVVALPRSWSPDDFGYLFEDLASRGFLVAAGVDLPLPSPELPPFSWSAALNDLLAPVSRPEAWLEPEKALAAGAQGDLSLVPATLAALHQLDAEPGDVVFSGIDWEHVGLWIWGQVSPPPADRTAWGVKGVIHWGAWPEAKPSGLELWVNDKKAPAIAAGRWYLSLPSLARADLADTAYLKPYLAAFGLKSQADAGVHPALRQYQAAFYQFALWGSGGDTAFGQTVPQVPGVVLTGQ